MGVSGFVSKYLKNLQSQSEFVRKTCAVFFADYNQCLHESMELFGAMFCEPDPKDLNIQVIKTLKTEEQAWTELKKMMERIITMKIAVLKTYTQLEEIYIAMDGTPCYGKIQQQMKRRKESRKFTLNGKTVFSSAMTLPGTRLTEEFSKILDQLYTKFVEDTKNSDGSYRLKLTKSLTDIAGEGEHKILDMVRKHKYADYSENVGEKTILVMSNDSDSVISLIHQNVSSVFIDTRVFTRGIPQEKIISIDEVKKTIVSDHMMLKNMPLLLAFAGNDFLPEMLNAQNFDVFHDAVIATCIDTKKRIPLNLTKEFTPEGKTSSVTVIDYDKLMDFFSNMSSIEMQMYISKTPATPNCMSEKPAIIRGKEPGSELDFIQMKYRYYEKAFINYNKHVKGIEIKEPKEETLVEFEMQMARAYLKTYVWYYYYQSGFEVSKPLDNSYYEYCYPPLYNSLYILLAGGKKDFLIEFSHEHNPELIPRERDYDYFERQPCFNELHHYMVLQKEDYELVCPEDQRIFDREIDHVKNSKNFDEKTIPLRYFNEKKPNYLQVYPFLNIFDFMERYKARAIVKEKKKTVLGRSDDFISSKKITSSRFAIGNKKLNFGELPDNKLL